MRLICLGLVALILAEGLVGQEEFVTARQQVRVGPRETVTLRQINGRWWTPDNRMVNPKGVGGWVIDAKPGVTQFFHHRPFDIRVAEYLHLFMTPYQVIVAIGYPNRVFQTAPGEDLCQNCIPNEGFWYYYAQDGTILTVRMMDAELGEAEYEPLDGPSKNVASVERELNGKSIFSLMADRAYERVKANGGIHAPERIAPPLIRYPVASTSASSK